MALLLNQVTSSGNDMGAAGANHAHGLVPDPGSVADAAGANRFLRSDATWDQVDYASVTGTPAAGQLPGTATNDNAAAGNVGEYVTTSTVTGVNLSNNTVANITSITLSAGDWDISGMASLTVGGAATASFFEAQIDTTSASFGSPVESGTAIVLQVSMSANFVEQIALPTVRASIAASTTFYLNVEATITAASTGGGRLRARRMR